MSMAAKIRSYQANHPTATPRMIADALKVKPTLVHQVRWTDKKNAEKKAVKSARRGPGRPPKTDKAVEPRGQVVVREEIIALNAKVDDLRRRNFQLKTVISYLEHQLGLNDSQRHGAPV